MCLAALWSFILAKHPWPFIAPHLTAVHFFKLPIGQENHDFHVTTFGIMCFYLLFFFFLLNGVCFRIPTGIFTLFLSPKCLQIIARRKRPGRSAKNPAVGAKVKSTGLQLLGQTEAAEQSEWQVGNNSYESPAVLWITTCWEDIARSVILRIGTE